MDIITGLSAASQAVAIVKELREIDRSVDEATYKLKIAELIEALADTKIGLADAKEQLAEKDREIKRLAEELETRSKVPICPICSVGELKTISVVPHPQFGPMGHQEHTLKCQNSECNHTERRKVDPATQ